MKKILLALCLSLFFPFGQVKAQCTSTTVYPYNAMQTTVTIYLNSATAGGTYHIEYGPVGFTPGTAGTAGAGGILVAIPTNQNFVNLTGLTANTAYDVYCRKNCSGSWSTNSTARRINTAYDCSVAPTIGCGVMNSYPHPYGEGAWYSMCYQTIPNANGSGTERIYSFTPTVSGMHMVYVPANSDVTTFSYKPASQACDNLGWLCLGTTNNNNHLPGQYPFGPLTAGVQYWFRTDTEFINAYDTAVFRIECPYCVTPSAIATSNITTNTATVSFTSSGPNNYVEYGPEGFVPGNGPLAGPGGTIVNAGSYNSVNLTSLSLSTQYDVYVRRNCGGGNFSPNSLLHSFYTKNCPLNAHPYSWSPYFIFNHSLVPGEYSNFSSCGYPSTNGSEHRMWFTASYTGLLQMKLSSSGYLGPQSFSMIVSQNCAIGNVPCQSPVFPPANTNGLIYSIPVVAGNDYDIMVDVDSVLFPTGSTMLVELTCPQPREVSVNAIQPTSVNINWNCTGSTGYTPCQNQPIIEYGPLGFVPGTGAAAGTNGTIVTGSSMPFSLTGLQPFTAYDVYLRSACGTQYSNNTTKVSFRTAKDCGLATVLNCGSYAQLSGTYLNAIAPNGAWTIASCGNANNASQETLWKFTPTQTNVYTITIYRLTGTANYSSAGNFYIKPESAGCTETSWNCLGAVSGTTASFVPVTYSLGTLNAGTTYLIMGEGVQPISTTYNYHFRLDCPDVCSTPLITGATTTVNTATVSTICPNCPANSYLEYGPAGFTPGTGGVAGVGGVVIHNPAASQLITGLVPSTSYDAYFRTDCGASGGFSLNTSKITFTPCFTSPSSASATPANNVCSGTSVKLKQIGGAVPPGGTFKWYIGCGTTLVGTGDSIFVNPTATTTYQVRIESNCGTSICRAVTVSVTAINAVITPGGPTTFCQGGSVSLNASTGSGYSWQWIKDGVPINGATGSIYNTSSPGLYSVQITHTSGCSATSSPVSVVVNSNPVVSFTGLLATYNETDPPATLIGNPTGGVFSGSGISGNLFYPSVAGVGGPYNIVYTYTDANGCSGSGTSAVTVVGCAGPPSTPGTISSSGFPTVCPGETRTYSISSVSGATSYVWVAPSGGTITGGQGTTAVSISYSSSFTTGDTVRVSAANNCGQSAQRKLYVGRNNPGVPSTISGESKGTCNMSGVPYSVTAVSGMNYNWSFNTANAVVASGQGSSAINANFLNGFLSGTLSVTASNGCGTSSARTLSISAIPAAPASITGPTAVCSGQQGVPYSITPLYGAANYTWSGPSKSKFVVGSTISPTNTLTTTASSVAVNYGNKTGTLKVRGNNACGSSAYTSISITFNCRESASEPQPESIDIVIIPNPASDHVLISFDTDAAYEIEVLNLLGERVLFVRNEKNIDISALPDGIYIARVLTGNSSYTARFVKAK